MSHVFNYQIVPVILVVSVCRRREESCQDRKKGRGVVSRSCNIVKVESWGGESCQGRQWGRGVVLRSCNIGKVESGAGSRVKVE